VENFPRVVTTRVGTARASRTGAMISVGLPLKESAYIVIRNTFTPSFRANMGVDDVLLSQIRPHAPPFAAVIEVRHLLSLILSNGAWQDGKVADSRYHVRRFPYYRFPNINPVNLKCLLI